MNLEDGYQTDVSLSLCEKIDLWSYYGMQKLYLI